MSIYVDPGDAVNWDASLNRGGLVSWWLALPDQQRGVMFRDLCGRSHGTLTNGPTWAGPIGRPGGWGSLGSVTGADRHALVPYDARRALTTAGTVSCWFRSKSTNDIDWLIRSGTDQVTGWRLNAHWSDAFQIFTLNNSFISSTGLGIFGTRQWNHVAFVWVRAATITFYLNGKFVSTSDVSAIGDFAINSDTDGTKLLSAGTNESCDLDDVRIVPNVAFSAGQIAELYSLSRRGYPGLLNWQRRYRYAPEQGGAVTAYPWHYYQQMMAG